MMKHGRSYKKGTNGSFRTSFTVGNQSWLCAPSRTLLYCGEPIMALRTLTCPPLLWGTNHGSAQATLTLTYPPLLWGTKVPSRALLYGNLAVPCNLIVSGEPIMALRTLTCPPLREPRGSL